MGKNIILIDAEIENIQEFISSMIIDSEYKLLKNKKIESISIETHQELDSSNSTRYTWYIQYKSSYIDSCSREYPMESNYKYIKLYKNIGGVKKSLLMYFINNPYLLSK